MYYKAGGRCVRRSGSLCSLYWLSLNSTVFHFIWSPHECSAGPMCIAIIRVCPGTPRIQCVHGYAYGLYQKRAQGFTNTLRLYARSFSLVSTYIFQYRWLHWRRLPPPLCHHTHPCRASGWQETYTVCRVPGPAPPRCPKTTQLEFPRYRGQSGACWSKVEMKGQGLIRPFWRHLRIYYEDMNKAKI